MNRRTFVKTGLGAGAAALGASGLDDAVLARTQEGLEDSSGRLSSGDAAILRFLAALEIIETDLWVQYNELGGIQDSEVPGGSGNSIYTEKLKNLDEDMDQYIHDNTENEFTHEVFLNAYLVSKGAEPADLDSFRTLAGSKATGSSGKPRLTNLMQLTIDTSWWTRYRSATKNPDLNPGFKFPQAVPDLFAGQFPAIPRRNSDLSPDAHIQAIANTAAFHFATIEQGGTSLYPSLAQRVSSPEVLRVVLSIGPVEMAHFQTWHDKAGAAVSSPIAPLTDPTNGLTFPDLNAPPLGGEAFQTNLIMPEPSPFLRRSLPACSIVRPTATKGAAMGALTFLTNMGLFMGQSSAFFGLMSTLAEDADAATRS
jgi:hypothetical protein